MFSNCWIHSSHTHTFLEVACLSYPFSSPTTLRQIDIANCSALWNAWADTGTHANTSRQKINGCITYMKRWTETRFFGLTKTNSQFHWGCWWAACQRRCHEGQEFWIHIIWNLHLMMWFGEIEIEGTGIMCFWLICVRCLYGGAPWSGMAGAHTVIVLHMHFFFVWTRDDNHAWPASTQGRRQHKWPLKYRQIFSLSENCMWTVSCVWLQYLGQEVMILSVEC